MDDVPTIQDIENGIAMAAQNAEKTRHAKQHSKSKTYVILAVVVVVAAVVIGLLVYFLVIKRADTTALPLDAKKPFYPTALLKSQMRPEWRMEIVSTSPVVQTIENFLDDKTCDALIALAEPRLKRSTVVDNVTGKNIHDSARTSYTVFFKRNETPLLKGIQEMAAKIANVPEAYLEGLQVVRYQHGQYYRPHFDYLPRTSDDVKLRGQRTATIFAYLNDLPVNEKGGGTKFHKLNKTFRPRRGAAVLWHNMADNKEDPRMLHSGEPIETKDATKYGLNIWVREFPQKDF
jgi:hypothetical protein